jgi:adenylate cyclase
MERVAIFLLPLLLSVALSLAPSATVGLATGIGFSALFLIGNYLLLSRYSLDLSLLTPLLALGLTSTASEIYRSLVVDQKGRYMKKAFSNYVSADLVAQIMKNPDILKLGGEKREISILFSDIRGFTSLSEKLSPEDLVQVLNEYLNPMTRIVLEEKGTLDKYIGDAVMALYNAPLDVDGHAAHACRTALKMILALNELNQSFVSRGIGTIDIGIGINTGDAVVGNMGSAVRFDYTAIGDNVNLASRLEGLNKTYGTHIIVSEFTKQLAGSDFQFRELDLVAVKGKHQPVPVYELMVVGDSELTDSFADALRMYREREFSQAIQIFERVAAQKQDKVSQLYAERCREFIASPPAAEWDGVFVAKAK